MTTSELIISLNATSTKEHLNGHVLEIFTSWINHIYNSKCFRLGTLPQV